MMPGPHIKIVDTQGGVCMKGLKRLRLERNLTQKQLAEMVTVSQSNIAMWETGAAMPSAAKLPELADVLHCTIDALYGRGIPKSGNGAAS